ncbi:PspC domain-containing protein [Nocardioides sp.]|uniref:PspC domain-containing protein n=1 Tax=Nocardioides sp. TaxID=35761 RepID=UPI0019A120D3|nr:PspC domain-containing protein [Nocardioides sp.]MBC7278256.1 PspC domain-containing protein [Nocardioides sp.]
MTIPPEAPEPPTTESAPAGSDPSPRPSRDQLRNLGALRRTTSTAPEGRHIAGVAGGIARHLDVDPLLVRVLLVVSVFFGGAGAIVYVAAWLFAPEDGHEDGFVPVGPPTRNLLLWVATGVATLSLLGDALGDTNIPWFWLLVLGIAAVWWLNRDKKKTAAPSNAPGYQNDPGDPGDPGNPGNPGNPHTAVFPVQPSPMPAPWTSVPPQMQLPRRPKPPLLFGPAIATAALVAGLLGLADVANWFPVSSSAYPAAVTAVFGAFLVLGAFWGRAGGLIALALVSLLVLAGTTAVSMVGHTGLQFTTPVDAQPQTVAELEETYSFSVGAARIDLGELDADTLDGERVEIRGEVGEITVIVPDDASIAVDARITGPGEAEVFETTAGDIDGAHLERTLEANANTSSEGEDPEADLHITAMTDVGAIKIFRESDPRAEDVRDAIERSIR